MEETAVVTGMQQRPEVAPRISPRAGCWMPGETRVETSPNGKKRWLGDLKDKSLHGVVLFIQNYDHDFLHIVLQEPRQKNPFLNMSCLMPTVCFTFFDAVEHTQLLRLTAQALI